MNENNFYYYEIKSSIEDIIESIEKHKNILISYNEWDWNKEAQEDYKEAIEILYKFYGELRKNH